MTPFMLRVAQAIDEPIDHEDVPELDLVPAASRDVGTGTERQIAIRSLAEQLVCEANAVMAEEAEQLTLVDAVGPEGLSFDIACGGHAVRVITTYADHRAYGRLVGEGVDPADPPQELSGEDALPDLLMRLILTSRAGV